MKKKSEKGKVSQTRDDSSEAYLAIIHQLTNF